MRGTTNRNARGNSYQRAARKLWLVRVFGSRCFWCGRKLATKKLEVDRWPTAGKDGGRYTWGNIVLACPSCNKLSDTKRVCLLVERL